jgi:myo-inositol-1(or 4)-monophosphatase
VARPLRLRSQEGGKRSEDRGAVSGFEGHDDALKTGNAICGDEAIHAEPVKILKPLRK